MLVEHLAVAVSRRVGPEVISCFCPARYALYKRSCDIINEVSGDRSDHHEAHAMLWGNGDDLGNRGFRGYSVDRTKFFLNNVRHE